MEEIGPVDYAVIAFPGNKFRGEIAPAISELVDAGTIRVIDIAFVGKDDDGTAVAMELTELDPEVQKGLEKAGVEIGGLFNEDDLMDIAEDLEPNSSAALLVWENVWARKVAQAMRDAGGELVAFERLPHEVVQAAREWALEQAKAYRREESGRCSEDEVPGSCGPRRRRRSWQGPPGRFATARSSGTPGRSRRRGSRTWRRSRPTRHRPRPPPRPRLPPRRRPTTQPSSSSSRS
jgi:hypothetical protein